MKAPGQNEGGHMWVLYLSLVASSQPIVLMGNGLEDSGVILTVLLQKGVVTVFNNECNEYFYILWNWGKKQLLNLKEGKFI